MTTGIGRCAPLAGRKRHADNARARHKKLRTPLLCGQRLPAHQLVQALSHGQLQQLVQRLVAHHPETAHTLMRLAPQPLADDLGAVLERGLKAVFAHLPYKCDVESDYSYARTKPHLTLFLHTLLDVVLLVLPPALHDVRTACVLLDRITHMVHELPNFANVEFQYTRSTAYEQLASAWLVALQRDEHERAQLVHILQLLQVAEMVDRHNAVAQGKFDAVAEAVRAELEAFEQLQTHKVSLGDLITVDYSNYSLSARELH